MSHNRVFVGTYPNTERAETNQDIVKDLYIVPEQDRDSTEGGVMPEKMGPVQLVAIGFPPQANFEGRIMEEPQGSNATRPSASSTCCS